MAFNGVQLPNAEILRNAKPRRNHEYPENMEEDLGRRGFWVRVGHHFRGTTVPNSTGRLWIRKSENRCNAAPSGTRSEQQNISRAALLAIFEPLNFAKAALSMDPSFQDGVAATGAAIPSIRFWVLGRGPPPAM